MLDVIGAKSLDDLLDQTVPATIRSETPLGLPAARTEPEVLAALRVLAARNRARTSLIGMGYHGTVTPRRDPAQRARGPGLVHRVHAVPGRDQPGPAGGAAQLPDHGQRADRLAGGQRLAARRGDGGGRGDGDGPPAQQVPTSDRFVVHHDTHPQTIAVLATRAEPIGDRPRRRRRRRRRRRLLRRPVQPADVDRRDRRLVGGDRAGPRRRRPGRRHLRSAGLRAAHSPGPARAPTSPSVRASASACRWASAVRTPPSSPPTSRRHAPFPDASSASAPTPPDARRCAWPCRPASSTSAARRPRRTSVRPRCCSPTSPASTPRGTARTGSPASPSGCTG